MVLYPFAEYWPFYVGFILFVLAVLSIDLGIFHRRPHVVSIKEASIWTIIWIGLALLFNCLFYLFSKWKFQSDPRLLSIHNFDPEGAATQSALEFLTGFIVEKSLAIDNIFVFAIVFSYFAIPKIYQHRILFYGIIGALCFRALFIALGSYLMQYHLLVVFFGVVLIITGIKMFLAPSQMMDPEKNILLKILRKIFRIESKVDSANFFIKKNGLLYATPLFIALVFVEISDIIFAVDSVPAIFALTKEPLIVFTSNIFAILGLRSMYFMLVGVMDNFIYIKYGLASVLIFVGLKMTWLNNLFDGKFPILWSLGIILALILSSMIASVIFPRKLVVKTVKIPS